MSAACAYYTNRKSDEKRRICSADGRSEFAGSCIQPDSVSQYGTQSAHPGRREEIPGKTEPFNAGETLGKGDGRTIAEMIVVEIEMREIAEERRFDNRFGRIVSYFVVV
jgi:hypothetical protein